MATAFQKALQKSLYMQRIEQGRKPWPSVKGLEDEELVNGSITVWPMKFMKRV